MLLPEPHPWPPLSTVLRSPPAQSFLLPAPKRAVFSPDAHTVLGIAPGQKGKLQQDFGGAQQGMQGMRPCGSGAAPQQFQAGLLSV